MNLVHMVHPFLEQHNLELTSKEIAHIWALPDNFYRYKPGTWYSINSIVLSKICKSLNLKISLNTAQHLMYSIEGDSVWCGTKQISNHGGRKITTICQGIKSCVFVPQ